VPEYDSIIEDSYRKRCVVDSAPCLLDILDTPGQEEFIVLREQWIRNGEGFILGYCITDYRSFKYVNTIRNEIVKFHGEAYPMILVGGKCDLVDKREVTTAGNYSVRFLS